MSAVGIYVYVCVFCCWVLGGRRYTACVRLSIVVVSFVFIWIKTTFISSPKFIPRVSNQCFDVDGSALLDACRAPVGLFMKTTKTPPVTTDGRLLGIV